MFTLEAQVVGTTRRTHAESDGFGITVHTSAGPIRSRSVNDAIRIARDDIGEFLAPAERPGRPWGLRVQVAGVQAVYGDWPLLPGPPSRGRAEDSPVRRIRSRWHESGPLSALANGVQIIRAYLPDRRAAA